MLAPKTKVDEVDAQAREMISAALRRQRAGGAIRGGGRGRVRGRGDGGAAGPSGEGRVTRRGARGTDRVVARGRGKGRA